jgi:hypothetical protein
MKNEKERETWGFMFVSFTFWETFPMISEEKLSETGNFLHLLTERISCCSHGFNNTIEILTSLKLVFVSAFRTH